MILDLAAAYALAQQCAPGVAAETLLAVVHTESAFDTLAIGVNVGPRLGVRPRTPADAAREARRRLKAGGDVDLGLGQINSRNLAWLGLSVDDAFDPCRNLAGAAKVLAFGYRASVQAHATPQAALRDALSRYNTGDPVRGHRNGYVARVEASARTIFPALGESPSTVAPMASPDPIGPNVSARPTPYPAIIFTAPAASSSQFMFGAHP